MNNKGKRVYQGSSYSDIFFNKPEPLYTKDQYNLKLPLFKRQLSISNGKENCNLNEHKSFSKAKLINNTSTFEINPNKTCDIVDIKKTLNKNGINAFNIKNNCSSLSRNKIVFNTVYIDPKDQKFKTVKEELKSKGVEIKLANNNHSFTRHDNIVPANTTYIDVRNYSKVVPRSISQINMNNGRKHIVTKNGFSDTKFKNFTKENKRIYTFSPLYNKK